MTVILGGPSGFPSLVPTVLHLVPAILHVSGSLGATAPQLLWFCFLHSHMYTCLLYAVSF